MREGQGMIRSSAELLENAMRIRREDLTGKAVRRAMG